MAYTEHLAPQVSACFLAVCLSECVFVCSAPDGAGSWKTVQDTVGQRRLAAACDSIGQSHPFCRSSHQSGIILYSPHG